MLTNEELDQVIEAVRRYDAKHHEEILKKKKDSRLRNTRLLLKNYNYFKVHAEDAVYSASQLLELGGILNEYDPHIFIQSIKNSSHKTFVILSHINKMLEIYKKYSDMCGKRTKREYDIMVKYFLQGVKTSDISAEYEVDERTIQRDITDSVNHFSCFVFGFDSLSNMSE